MLPFKPAAAVYSKSSVPAILILVILYPFAFLSAGTNG